MTRCIALILAGGVGNRMHLSVPKQFTEVNGLSVLQYTMLAFQRHKLVDAVYVVAAPKWQEIVKEQAMAAGIQVLQHGISRCHEYGLADERNCAYIGT